ncbi:MAG: hypothetical protein AAGE84_00235 [Cyanobacteria bacterium P01_G01_bin.39]
MKHIVISSLSAITFSTLATPAFAMQPVSFNPTPKPNQVTPLGLVTASYQGRLAVQGIPGNDAFLSAISSNKIDAQDLIQGAIASGRLSQDTLDNQDYLDSVASLLDDLDFK